MARRGILSGLVAVMAAAALAACGNGSLTPVPSAHTALAPATRSAPAGGTPPSAIGASGTTSPAATVDHVVVVIFENKAYDSVMGHASVFGALAAAGTTYTNSHGIAHPSQPNYLALFSGSTQGVLSDSCPHTFHTANLGSQLIGSGLTFTGYAEALPYSGYDGCSAGRYARKHAPWTDFAGLPTSTSQPYSAFPTDYSTLPSVSFVVPDLCDDMHDCSVSTGNAWLGAHMADYATWARGHHSLLLITFDEDNGTSGNWIPTIAVGQGVPVGQVSAAVDQYSVLHTIENCFGLPPLGDATDARPLPNVCA